MSDTLAHFTALDELIQIIYQGPYRFVVLSKLDEDTTQWTLHLGLAERWWRGVWREKDVLAITGSKATSKILEAFADKLVETFIRGELSIGNWSSEKGAEINLTLGPTSKKPIVIPLHELSSVDAASHATTVFTDIALQAQSRKCRLNPSSSYTPLAAVSPPPASHSAPALPATNIISAAASSSTSRPAAPVSKTKTSTNANPDDKLEKVHESDQDEIKKLKAELAKAQQEKDKRSSRSATPGSSTSKAATTGTKRPPKGASLANPNKKARKYQAIEFESDEE